MINGEKCKPQIEFGYYWGRPCVPQCSDVESIDDDIDDYTHKPNVKLG